jgi:formylmethanofuran dehydrogenase subunit B
LLCDSFGVTADAGAAGLRLTGSDCPRASQALARFAPVPSPSAPLVGGQAADLSTAITAAARLLHGSRQPLFSGLGTDVSGARALFALAMDSGAISDAANGAALMHGLRALQDRGAFTTTLAEVRTRADLIVCIGGSPTTRLPEFFYRCGVGEATVAARHVVFLGGAADEINALAGLPGVTLEAPPMSQASHRPAQRTSHCARWPGACRLRTTACWPGRPQACLRKAP